MKKLAIIAAGDLGQQIAHLCHSINDIDAVGFYDDFNKANTAHGLPILGTLDEIESDFKNKVYDTALIAIGYKHIEFRSALLNRLTNAKSPLATIIHPQAWVDPSATIEEGTVIMPRVVIDQNCHIKKNVFININASIAHDSIIDDNCFIAPSVSIAGFVNIQKNCFLGINSTIIDNLTICANSIIGAGSLLTKDIDKAGLYFGSPAKKR